MFRFREGERVATPRGADRIRQGYAAGPLVQCEIERDSGAPFTANERDLRRQ